MFVPRVTGNDIRCLILPNSLPLETLLRPPRMNEQTRFVIGQFGDLSFPSSTIHRRIIWTNLVRPTLRSFVRSLSTLNCLLRA